MVSIKNLKRKYSKTTNAPDGDQYSTEGAAYGLATCHDSEDAVADIIFVHGLTGNRENTWTHKPSRVFWPRDLLSLDVPKTRILTFGYDADVSHFWSVASQNRIRDHAANLINYLAHLRHRTQTENRPIFFVAHSLGGLVFQDAMLTSRSSAEPHIQRINTLIHGVCFLGTPHCGSTWANWAHISSQMQNIVQKTNTAIVEVLKPKSEVLARIQSDFHSMIRGRQIQGQPALNITCFFEDGGFKGLGEIVPRHSAVIPGYTAIGITGNHTEITKFSSESNEGYRSISGEIMRWVGEIRKARDDNEQNSLALVHSSAQSFTPYGRELSLPAQQNSQSSLGEVATQLSSRSLNQRQPRGVWSQSQQEQRSTLDGQQLLYRPIQLGTETIGSINISNPGLVVSGNTFHGPVRFG